MSEPRVRCKNMVVIRYYYVGCKNRPTTWYSSWDKRLQIRNLQLQNLSMAFLRGFPDGNNIGSTVYCRGEGHNIWINSMMSGRRPQERQTQRQYSTPSSIVLGNIGSTI